METEIAKINELVTQIKITSGSQIVGGDFEIENMLARIMNRGYTGLTPTTQQQNPTRSNN